MSPKASLKEDDIRHHDYVNTKKVKVCCVALVLLLIISSVYKSDQLKVD